MKNRKLILILSLVLALTMSLGGTLAYLTDTDSDVNTMVLGNVKIEQHEYERAKNDDGTFKTDTIDGVESYVLQSFTQDKPLVPSAVVWNGEGWDWADNIEKIATRMTQVGSYGKAATFTKNINAQDKYVTVENKGNTDAYVRTYVAFEIGSTDGSLIGKADRGVNAADVGTPKDTKDPWIRTAKIDKVQLNGNYYMVFEYVYRGAELSNGTWRHENGILPAGDTSYPSLCQVFLMHTANNADLEAIDGNDNGKLDIIVLSQAVQADGFGNAQTALEAGFPSTKTENGQTVKDTEIIAGWLEAASTDLPEVKMVANAAELTGALAEVKANSENWNEPVTVNLAGKEYEGTFTVELFPNGVNGNNCTDGTEDVVNMTVVGNGNTVITGEMLVNGFGNAQSTNFTDIAGSITFKNMIFDGKDGKIVVKLMAAADNVTFENCTFKNSTHVTLGASGVNRVGDVTFIDCEFENGNCLSGYYASLTVKDCTVKNAYKGFINNNGIGSVTVENCDIECAGYVVRTQTGSDQTINVKDSRIKVAENEEGQALVWFRGNGTATFNGCSLSTKEVNLKNFEGTYTLTVDGEVVSSK